MPGGQAHAWGGESFDRHKGRLGLGQSFGEVRGRRDRGREPVPQPADLVFRGEDGAVQVHRGGGDRASVPFGPPVDELSFRDGEAHAEPGPSGLQHRVPPLQGLDVTPIGRGGNSQTKVIDIGEGEPLGDQAVKTGNINNKQKWGDGGALRCAHGDWGKHLWRPLVSEAAGPARQEGPGPGDEVWAHRLLFKYAAQR